MTSRMHKMLTKNNSVNLKKKNYLFLFQIVGTVLTTSLLFTTAGRWRRRSTFPKFWMTQSSRTHFTRQTSRSFSPSRTTAARSNKIKWRLTWSTFSEICFSICRSTRRNFSCHLQPTWNGKFWWKQRRFSRSQNRLSHRCCNSSNNLLSISLAAQTSFLWRNKSWGRKRLSHRNLNWKKLKRLRVRNLKILPE